MSGTNRWTDRMWRLSVPPLEAVMVLLIGEVALRGFFDLIVWRVGLGTQLPQQLSEIWRPWSMGWSILAIFGYGVLRAFWFHPLLQLRYSSWLSTAPWQYPTPLPLGPVTLHVFDALPVATAMILVHCVGGDVRIPLTVFVVAYVAVLAAYQPRWLGWFWFYAMLLVTPVVALLWNGAWWETVLVVGVLVALSQVGADQMLRCVAWARIVAAERKKEKALRSTREWLAGPTPVEDLIGPLHGAMLPVVLGWWFWCLLRGFGCIQWNSDDSTTPLFFFAGFSAAFYRWFFYCGRRWAPISLRGRVWTGRWIVPGYDYVLIAPLITAAVGVELPSLLKWLGWAPPETIGLWAAAVAACVIWLPPTMRSWRLRGQYRMLGAVPEFANWEQRRRVTGENLLQQDVRQMGFWQQ